MKRKNKVGPFEENFWIKNHGGVIISEVLEGEGGIWLLAQRSPYALPHHPYYGLVARDERSWGEVDISWLYEMKQEGELVNLFKEQLPCTLRELFEQTLVWTYFSD